MTHSMEPEVCQHISTAAADWFVEITSDSGEKHSLCFDCYIASIKNFRKSDTGNDEVDVIGYHVYRSTDPDLPKTQWTRVTPEPIPVNKFKDKGLTGGVTYYYYVTAVSAQGVESPPSEVASVVAPSSSLVQ